MSEAVLTRPTLQLPTLRLYPEREDPEFGWRYRVGEYLHGAWQGVAGLSRGYRYGRFVQLVNRQRFALEAVDPQAFTVVVDTLRNEVRRYGLNHSRTVRAFAVIREAARRSVDLFHYDVQLEGAYALLNGLVAELETGEGKTLTATLAAGTAAMAGKPVHVITVNDYLAQRDCEFMRPIYEALGLSVGVVVSGMDADQRREAYRADITYCTNKEVAFDYLRDRMHPERNGTRLRARFSRLARANDSCSVPVMRGLYFAIVDEADSILIDEARTPLIISGCTDPKAEQAQAEVALRLAAMLEVDEHFALRRDRGVVELNDRGGEKLAECATASALDGPWRGTLFREEQVRNALAALHLFQRGDHYLVRDDKIEIIDENTGRVMPDRSWSDGLHQMVEVKEGCRVTGQNVPLARMTYQRFFRRYLHLAGMTGTAREAKRELWQVYRLPVMRIGTNRPMIRRYAGTRVFRTKEDKWRHIVSRTQTLAALGLPVLIGTRSVASSQEASDYLEKAGMAHAVLNAEQDAQEAEIIARAGQRGQVTVATNMAGRGVDIRLGTDVIEAGGLHVIMSECHDSGRIDRQLFGRCARQGEPGHVEVVLSLEDTLLRDAGVGSKGPMLGGVSQRLFRRAQRRMERRHAQVRRDLMRWDQRMGTALAFTGRME